MKTEAQKRAQKRWKEKNKDHVRAYELKWKNERYATDPEFRKKVRARAKANPDRQTELARESAARRRKDPDRAALLSERARVWRFKNKEKVSAHNKLNYAVRKGRIIKPTECSECGATPRKIEAHHHNGYDHPFDVVWLCTRCHVKVRSS